MSSIFSKLTTRISMALVAVVMVSFAVTVFQWHFVIVPKLEAAEQTKAELLIVPYTQLLEAAVDAGNKRQIENILNQLILLEDATYSEPIILRLKVSLADGQVFEKTNTMPVKSAPFMAETPLFSPATMLLVGSVKLEYNNVFHQRIVSEVREDLAWSLGVAVLLLAVVQRWVSWLLRPLSLLSGRLARVNVESHVKLPPVNKNISSEIWQVWNSLEHLFARLRQRDKALEEEHAAAQDALQAKLEAEAESREKSQFLANMSHELRTPLNAIIGYSEMLHEEAGGAGNADLAEDLMCIMSSGRHLSSLIDDVLDLSKIEAGKTQLFLEDINVPDLVADVVHNVSPVISANGNSLEINCDNDFGEIYVDSVKLRQALINILGNAGKFTHNGRVSLSVERLTDECAEWVLFSVKDTGIGIHENQQRHLFNAFTQADDSTTRQYGGTGLGLTISRSVCRLMGGDIIVNSKPGGGSEFIVKVPTKIVDFDLKDMLSEEGAEKMLCHSGLSVNSNKVVES